MFRRRWCQPEVRYWRKWRRRNRKWRHRVGRRREIGGRIQPWWRHSREKSSARTQREEASFRPHWKKVRQRRGGEIQRCAGKKSAARRTLRAKTPREIRANRTKASLCTHREKFRRGKRKRNRKCSAANQTKSPLCADWEKPGHCCSYWTTVRVKRTGYCRTTTRFHKRTGWNFWTKKIEVCENWKRFYREEIQKPENGRRISSTVWTPQYDAVAVRSIDEKTLRLKF